jgi:hypothetical protein
MHQRLGNDRFRYISGLGCGRLGFISVLSGACHGADGFPSSSGNKSMLELMIPQVSIGNKRRQNALF